MMGCIRLLAGEEERRNGMRQQAMTVGDGDDEHHYVACIFSKCCLVCLGVERMSRSKKQPTAIYPKADTLGSWEAIMLFPDV